MSQHSWDKNCVHRIREPDWHLAPRCSVLLPQLQRPNWDTPPACLVRVCPPHPLSRAPEKPTDRKKQIPEHAPAISDAGYRAGRAGSSAAPFPERGFAASWHSQRRILMSAEGSWPLHPAGQASSTWGTHTGQRQMQAVHSYRWPLSNADNAFSLS